jgi:hypothetical protein
MASGSESRYGDAGVQYRMQWVPSGTGGSWVLMELKVERPSRRERRKGPEHKAHRPVTRRR